MKSFVFFIAILMPLLAFSQKPVIEFKATSHNIGTVSENGGNVNRTYTFKNTGRSPLILINVRSGCGCTTPKWSRKPIMPGATGSIDVIFDPRNRPGSFAKSITVISNATKSVISLTIRGRVSGKSATNTSATPYDGYKYRWGVVKATANSANFGKILHSKQLEKSIEIINSGEEAIDISIQTSSPAITVSVNPVSLKKGEKANLKISYDPRKKGDWGFIVDKLKVFENGKEKGSIQVTATINEDFSTYNNNFEEAPIMTLLETEAILSDLEPNKEHRHNFYIKNSGKSELIIRKIKSSNPKTKLTIAKNVIKPGKKVKVTMTFKTDNTRKKTEIVQFTSNAPQNPIEMYKLISTLKL